jgi:hypothetical protein
MATISWIYHLESFEVATMTWLTVMEYQCHKWSWIRSIFRKHFPVPSSFMTYHGFVTGAQRRMSLVEQVLVPFRNTWVHPRFFIEVHFTLSLVFCVVFWRSLLVFCPFFVLPFYYLAFFNLRFWLQIIHLLSSNTSCSITFWETWEQFTSLTSDHKPYATGFLRAKISTSSCKGLHTSTKYTAWI